MCRRLFWSAVTEPVTQTPSEPAEPETRAAQKATVKEAKIEPVRIYGVFPDTLKTEYLVGEKLDTTGIRVMVVYSDGSEQEVSPADCTVQTGNGISQDPGKYTVTVFYEGLSFSYGVTVNAVPESVILNSIYGVFPPDYTFTVPSFENIDLSDMTVKAVYSDVSGDGVLALADYALLASACVDALQLTEAQYKAADLNGDGAVDGFDLALLDLKRNTSVGF